MVRQGWLESRVRLVGRSKTLREYKYLLTLKTYIRKIVKN